MAAYAALCHLSTRAVMCPPSTRRHYALQHARPSVRLSVCPSLSNEVFCLPNICTDFARATMLRCVSLQESSSSLGLYLKIKILAYGTPSRALHLDKFRRVYGTSIVASCCQLSSTNVDARCHKLAPVVFRRSNSVDCGAGKNLVLKTGLGFFQVLGFYVFKCFCTEIEHESTTQKHTKNIPYTVRRILLKTNLQ